MLASSLSDCVGAQGFALLPCAVHRRARRRWRPVRLACEVARERAHGRVLQQRDDRQVRAQLVPAAARAPARAAASGRRDRRSCRRARCVRPRRARCQTAADHALDLVRRRDVARLARSCLSPRSVLARPRVHAAAARAAHRRSSTESSRDRHAGSCRDRRQTGEHRAMSSACG